MKLNDIKQILAQHGVQLTKSLGQNFLHDGNQLRRIVRAAQLRHEDKVLEIGPGLGPLTELLAAEAGELLAIEKDARLVTILRQRLAGTDNERSGNPGAHLELLEADALEYLRATPRDWHDWKLVANLPYAVASPILVELALNPKGPSRMVATLQLEVAHRLMAVPGNPNYGVLTLLVQLDYVPIESFKIPAGCFFPEPDVDSGCVVLARRSQPLLKPDRRAAFVSIVKRSFSQRRKMMAKLLKADFPPESLEHAFETVQLPLQIRAESVSLDQFVTLTDLLYERRDI